MNISLKFNHSIVQRHHLHVQITTLMQRARKAGVAERIHTLQCDTDSLGMEEQVDFILAFWMVHESPDQARMLAEFKGLLNAPEGRLLVAEPRMHVQASAFEHTCQLAQDAGLRLVNRPEISFSLSAVFSPA